MESRKENGFDWGIQAKNSKLNEFYKESEYSRERKNASWNQNRIKGENKKRSSCGHLDSLSGSDKHVPINVYRLRL